MTLHCSHITRSCGIPLTAISALPMSKSDTVFILKYFLKNWEIPNILANKMHNRKIFSVLLYQLYSKSTKYSGKTYTFYILIFIYILQWHDKKMYLHFRNYTIFYVLILDYLLFLNFIYLEFKIPRAKTNNKKSYVQSIPGISLLMLIRKSFRVIYNFIF